MRLTHVNITIEMKLLIVIGCLLIAMNVTADNRPIDNQLISAAANDDLSGVSKALAAGANINARDAQYGWTALGAAIALGKNSVVKFLLDKGAKPDKTALMSAAYGERIELMEVLLKKGVNINATNDEGNTALMTAASRNPEDPKAVQFLLEHGAGVNTRNSDGETALMMAASRDSSTAVVKLLLDKGADPNAKPFESNKPILESPALITVAESGQLKAAKLLLSRGADPNIRGNDGMDRGVTPLITASRYGHLDLVKLLLEKGADINAKRNDGARCETALLWALEYSENEKDYNTAIFLITNGAAVNLSDANDGNTALIMAVPWKKLELIKLLLERGANVNSTNSYGMSALTVAVEVGDAEMVKLLLDNGARIDPKLNIEFPISTPKGPLAMTNGTTILTIAKFVGNTNILRLLEQAGANK